MLKITVVKIIRIAECGSDLFITAFAISFNLGPEIANTTAALSVGSVQTQRMWEKSWKAVLVQYAELCIKQWASSLSHEALISVICASCDVCANASQSEFNQSKLKLLKRQTEKSIMEHWQSASIKVSWQLKMSLIWAGVGWNEAGAGTEGLNGLWGFVWRVTVTAHRLLRRS